MASKSQRHSFWIQPLSVIVVSMATPCTNYICLCMKQKGELFLRSFKQSPPPEHEHALPYTPTSDRVYISKRLKTIKTHFDRRKQFGLLFSRLVSSLQGFLWSCPSIKTLVPRPKFSLWSALKKHGSCSVASSYSAMQ